MQAVPAAPTKAPNHDLDVMKHFLKINCMQPEPEKVVHISEYLLQGKTIIYPTDTIYGLGCNPFRIDALQYVERIKGRTAGKAFILLIPDLHWVFRLTYVVPPIFDEIAGKLWPGPLTLVFKAATSMPNCITGPQGTIALRWARSAFLNSLLSNFSLPILSTSVNRSGEPPLVDPTQSISPILKKVDLVVDAGAMAQIASTVLDLTTHPPRIVREGTLPRTAFQSLGIDVL